MLMLQRHELERAAELGLELREWLRLGRYGMKLYYGFGVELGAEKLDANIDVTTRSLSWSVATTHVNRRGVATHTGHYVLC